MKLRILAALVFVSLMIAATPSVMSDGADAAGTVAEGVDIDGVTYTLYDDNTAEVTGYTGSPAELDILAVTYDGWDYTVIAVGPGAFSGCASLAAVSMASVKSIGERAFENCTGLASIDLPMADDVGERAFSGCTSLASIDLPMAVSIGDRAFSGCTSLTTLDSYTVTDVGSNAFEGCTGLSYAGLYAATDIGDSAFSGCTALMMIDMMSVTRIGDSAFSGCSGLREVRIGQGLTTVGEGAFLDTGGILLYYQGDLDAIERMLTDAGASISYAVQLSTDSEENDAAEAIAEGVDIDGVTYTLYEDGTAEITGRTGFIEELSADQVSYGGATYTVTAVGGSAFEGDLFLTSVGLRYVTSVGDEAFSGCGRLTSVDLPSATSVGAGAFYKCEALTTVSMPSLTVVGLEAFAQCISLSSIDLPNVQIVGMYAFSHCSSLTEIELPSAQRVYANAFEHCGVATAVLPSLAIVYEEAFLQCEDLGALFVGEDLGTVKEDAFLGAGTFVLYTTGDPDATGRLLTDAGASVSSAQPWPAPADSDSEDTGSDTAASACVALVAVAAIVAMAFIARKDRIRRGALRGPLSDDAVPFRPGGVHPRCDHAPAPQQAEP